MQSYLKASGDINNKKVVAENIKKMDQKNGSIRYTIIYGQIPSI